MFAWSRLIVTSLSVKVSLAELFRRDQPRMDLWLDCCALMSAAHIQVLSDRIRAQGK